MSVPELLPLYISERELYEKKGNKATFIGIEYLVKNEQHQTIQICKSRKQAQDFITFCDVILNSKDA